MRDDDIKYWFSLENGVHVPVREGESKREAVSKAISKKRNNTKIQEFKSKKQSNNKIKKMVKRENTYIPIRENEDEKKVLKEHSLRNNENVIKKMREKQERQRLLENGVRLSLGEKGEREVEEAQRNKWSTKSYVERAEQIREWAKEYKNDKNIERNIKRKLKNGEELTAKEYYGWLGSGPHKGSIILGGGKNGEDVRVGKNGKLELISNSEYEELDNGQKLYVGNKIKNYRRRKGK